MNRTIRPVNGTENRAREKIYAEHGSETRTVLYCCCCRRPRAVFRPYHRFHVRRRLFLACIFCWFFSSWSGRLRPTDSNRTTANRSNGEISPSDVYSVISRPDRFGPVRNRGIPNECLLETTSHSPGPWIRVLRRTFGRLNMRQYLLVRVRNHVNMLCFTVFWNILVDYG